MKEAISQKDLWDAQHKRRRAEHKDIANTPNEFAKECLGYIPEGAKVLDLGAASGRDSRFFVKEKNCEIYALDFSFTALKHLEEDAIADGSIDFIRPINADIKHIPLAGANTLDVIYARSSLHVSDLDLEKLLEQILSMLIELNLSSGKRVDNDSRYVNFIAQKQHGTKSN